MFLSHIAVSLSLFLPLSLESINISSSEDFKNRTNALAGLSAACEPKGHRFNSQSGHVPGLWARSSVGGA